MAEQCSFIRRLPSNGVRLSVVGDPVEDNNTATCGAVTEAEKPGMLACSSIEMTLSRSSLCAFALLMDSPHQEVNISKPPIRGSRYNLALLPCWHAQLTETLAPGAVNSLGPFARTRLSPLPQRLSGFMRHTCFSCKIGAWSAVIGGGTKFSCNCQSLVFEM